MKLNLIPVLVSLALGSGNMDAAAQKSNESLSALLPMYYNIKNALVSGDAGTASKQAAALYAALGGVDIKKMTTAEQSGFLAAKTKLTAGSKLIADTKDIARQREAFISLSADMISLAREVKLGTQPIYLDYCPMKKAWWMSAEQAIKNPYYGSSMLTCGSVKETLK